VEGEVLEGAREEALGAVLVSDIGSCTPAVAAEAELEIGTDNYTPVAEEVSEFGIDNYMVEVAGSVFDKYTRGAVEKFSFLYLVRARSWSQFRWLAVVREEGTQPRKTFLSVRSFFR
jgi:hypothetical protein